MAKKKRTNRPKQNRQTKNSQRQTPSALPTSYLIIGGGLIAVLLLALVWVYANRGAPDAPGEDESEVAAATEPSSASGATPLPVGRVTDCQQLPAFTEALDFEQVSIDTTGESRVGIFLFDPTAATLNESSTHQDPTWDDAGYVGSHTLDDEGNIFVVTWPRIDLAKSPLAVQNVLYRVDAATGVMEPYMEMPAVRPPSLSNPFGTAGVAYDCDTNSLYVSTLTGSTRTEQAGRIVRIALDTNEIVNQWEGIDAFGIVVFNGSQGKRLYYGLAREPEVWSVALDANGDFAGQPRQEFVFSDYGSTAADSARRLTINAENVMMVDTVKFKFTLEQPADRTRISYAMRYNADEDRWRLQEVIQK